MAVFKDLMFLDEELRKFDVVLDQEKQGLSGAKGELDKVQRTLTEQRKQLETLEADKNNRVQEARVLTQQLDRSRDKIGRARNEKESNAVQRELEETRKLIRDAEDLVGKRTLEIDALKKAMATTEEAEKKWLTELGASEGAANTRIEHVAAQRAEIAVRRQEVAAKLPIALFRRYDQIRGRRQSGASFFEAGRCKACNMSVPPMIAQRVSRQELIEQCPSCARFLWVEPLAPLPANGE